MTNRIAYFRLFSRLCAGGVLVGFLVLGEWVHLSYGALLDGVFNEFEESLAKRLQEKGETLTVGDFYSAERPDGHGPIGTMGNHTHNKGEFMFSYRYMNMFMNGSRIGTSGLSNAQVLSPTGYNFLVTPQKMTMEMHMFSGMYGVNDTLTLMVMLPYIHNSMDLATRSGTLFSTDSTGIGDIQVQTLTRLYAIAAPSIGTHRAHLMFGLSSPTGSINKRGQTPMGNQLLPYPMQTGTGTFALVPGLVYAGEKQNVSWGVMGQYFIQMGRNHQNYSVGNKYYVTGWSAYRIRDWISASFRFNYQVWSNYDGADPRLNQAIAYTARPDLRGGQRLDVFGGANILFPEFMGYENRLAIEYGAPIYQYLDGPQLETDHIFWLGWQLVH